MVPPHTNRCPAPPRQPERVELSRRLAEAVLTLEEPYRSAVIWRHLDGLSAKQIGERQGTSPETARQRVSRGLAMLRVQLDSSFGDRATWCAVLALRFDLPSWSIAASGAHLASAGAAAALGIGGLAMTMKGVSVLAAAAALAILSWVGLRAAFERKEIHDITFESSRGVVVAGALSTIADEPPNFEGASGTIPPADDLPERSTVAPAEVIVNGSVRDRNAQPIAGARVRLERAGEVLDTAPVRETDANGHFQWSLAEAMLATAEVTAAAEHRNYFPASALAEAASSCELVLAARPVVEGRLLSPADRSLEGPFEVTLVVTDPRSDRPLAGETECLPDGSFLSRGLEEGRLIGIHGRAKGFALTWLALDEPLVAEGRIEVELVLEKGAVARGLVLDARTRRPIGGASVFAEKFRPEIGSCLPWTTTDSHGRFELIGIHVAEVLRANQTKVGGLSVVPIGAEATGYAPSHEMVVPSQLEQMFEGVELLLEPAGGTVAGRVLSPEHEPAVDMTVYLFDASGNVLTQRSESNGQFHFDALPEGPCTVFVRKEGCLPEARLWARHEAQVFAGAVSELELVLAPAATVMEGRVVDRNEVAVSGAQVEVRWFLDGQSMRLCLATIPGLTDDEGRYRFEHLYPGAYDLFRVVIEGRPDLALESRASGLQLGAGEHLSNADLVVTDPVAVIGRVGGQASDQGWEIQLRRTSDGQSVARTRSLPDGSFRLSGLFPTDFDLFVLDGDRELAHVPVGPEGASDLLVSLP